MAAAVEPVARQLAGRVEDELVGGVAGEALNVSSGLKGDVTAGVGIIDRRVLRRGAEVALTEGATGVGKAWEGEVAGFEKRGGGGHGGAGGVDRRERI